MEQNCNFLKKINDFIVIVRKSTKNEIALGLLENILLMLQTAFSSMEVRLTQECNVYTKDCTTMFSIDGAFSVQLQSYQKWMHKLEQIFSKKVREDIYLTQRIYLVTLKLDFCLSDVEHCYSPLSYNEDILKPLSVTTNVVGLQSDDADQVSQNSSAHVARVVGLQTDAVVVTETRLRTLHLFATACSTCTLLVLKLCR